MDTDLKIKSSCCQPPYDLVEAEGGHGGHHDSQNVGAARNNTVNGGLGLNGGGHRNPLKVMLSPEITAESDENELTSLNINQEKNSENENDDHKIISDEKPDKPTTTNMHSNVV